MVLDAVLGFVGWGEWLFIAMVSRLWRERYKKVEPESRTAWRAAIHNVGRLELGHAAGLDADVLHQYEFGRCCGGFDVFLRADELGLIACCEWVSEGAAREGRLSVLKEIYARNYIRFACEAHSAEDLQGAAARAPTPEILIWLKKNGIGKWDQGAMQSMMSNAAACGRIENGRWLVNTSATSSSIVFAEDTIFQAAMYNQLSFIQWARSRRCDWFRVSTSTSSSNFADPAFCCETVRCSPFADTTETIEWIHTQEDFVCSCGGRTYDV